jgi:hypothetical protein
VILYRVEKGKGGEGRGPAMAPTWRRRRRARRRDVFEQGGGGGGLATGRSTDAVEVATGRSRDRAQGGPVGA